MLKPCPFCQGEARVAMECISEDNDAWCFIITCLCGAEMHEKEDFFHLNRTPQKEIDKRKQTLIDRWNTRHHTPVEVAEGRMRYETA